MAIGSIICPGIKSGSCSYDPTYFNTPLTNYWNQNGQVVNVVFIAQIKTAVPNNTIFLRGFPASANEFRIIEYTAPEEWINSPSLNFGGLVANSSLTNYVITSDYVGQYLYLNFTYITTE